MAGNLSTACISRKRTASQKTADPAKRRNFWIVQEAKEQKNIEIIPKDRCITGQSGSGRCGAACYCTEPVDCCAKCNDDCNSRCGWIEKPKSVDTETPEETCETVIAPAQIEVIPVEAIDAKDIKTEKLSLDNLSIQINTDVWPEDLSDIPVPSELFIWEYLEEEEKTLRDYLECDGLPERTVLRQQLKVAGLRIILESGQETSWKRKKMK